MIKITLNRKILLARLSVCEGVAPRKSPKAILTHVLLVASEESLSIQATDEDMGLSTTMICEVEREGAICLPLNELIKIIKVVPQDHLTIEENGNEISICAGRSSFQLLSAPYEDFPQWAHKEAEPWVIPEKDLFRLVKKTLFCASAEETRYYLGGVFCEKVGDILRFVSTDGHRLALAECSLPQTSAPNKIIPRKMLEALQKALSPDSEERIEVSIGPKISFRIGETRISGSPIQGDFPDYRQVIPPDPEIFCRVERKALLAGIRQAQAMSPGGKDGGLLLSLGQELTLEAKTIGRGSARVEVSCGHIQGTIQAGYNGQYLAAALEECETEEVSLNFKSIFQPCVIRPIAGPNHENEFFVVMPMRI